MARLVFYLSERRQKFAFVAQRRFLYIGLNYVVVPLEKLFAENDKVCTSLQPQ